MLSDQKLVEHLCNTKPEESPVKYVKVRRCRLKPAEFRIKSAWLQRLKPTHD
jgi:hypothetical protein